MPFDKLPEIEAAIVVAPLSPIQPPANRLSGMPSLRTGQNAAVRHMIDSLSGPSTAKGTP